MKKRIEDNYYKNEYKERLPKILSSENTTKELDKYLKELINAYVLKSEFLIKFGNIIRLVLFVSLSLVLGYNIKFIFPTISFVNYLTCFAISNVPLLIFFKVAIEFWKFSKKIKGNDRKSEMEEMIYDLIEVKSKFKSQNKLIQYKSLLTDKIEFLKVKRDCQRKVDLMDSKVHFSCIIASIIGIISFRNPISDMLYLFSCIKSGIEEFKLRKTRNFKLYEIKEIEEFERDLEELDNQIGMELVKSQQLEHSKDRKYGYRYTPSNKETINIINNFRQNKSKRRIKGYYK